MEDVLEILDPREREEAKAFLVLRELRVSLVCLDPEVFLVLM